MIEIRWHGRGGQGAFTAARLLGLSAALFEEKFAMAFPSFGPERRGAPVLAFTKIDQKAIQDRSAISHCDGIVILDETLLEQKFLNDLKLEGVVFINTSQPEKYSFLSSYQVVAFDATALAREILGRPVTNTAMLGALAAATHWISLEAIVQGIQKEFSPALAAKNIEIVKRSYEMTKGEKRWIDQRYNPLSNLSI